MSRTALIRSFIALIAIGLVLAVTPFFISLTPSEKSIAALPRIKVPAIQAGQFAFVEDPQSTSQWPSALLLFRQRNGELFVWVIPTKDGVVAMPDIHWWRGYIKCPSFAPDISKEVISCSDPGLSAWWKENYRWRLDGKNINGVVDDMQRINGEERSGEFIYRMRRG